MITGSTKINLDQIFPIIVFIWLTVSIFYFRYKRKNRQINVTNSPILLTYYTEGTLLIPAKKGKFGDLNYSAFVTLPIYMDSSGTSALIFRVELPFYSSIHLLGIPKKTGAIRLDPTKGNSVMERIDLEGNYSQFFDLFCEHNMQESARYVLDPEAMIFTLDFCQSQNWELVDNDLYFVKSNGMHDPNDPTYLLDDILTFVKEIRPAVEKPLTDLQKSISTPYGEDRRNDLLCPFCNSILQNNSKYFSCPNGHGTLISGKSLANLKNGKLTIPYNGIPYKRIENTIKCPSCGNIMNKVKYDGGTTIIDSCIKCPYRWLDAGEYKSLT